MLAHHAQLFAALAWTIIHSLWQAAALWLAYTLARRISPAVRVRIAVGQLGIAVFLVLQAITFVNASEMSATLRDFIASAKTDSALTPQGLAMPAVVPSPWLLDCVAVIEPALPWVAAVWLAGLIARLVRLTTLFAMLRFELRRCRPISSEITESLNQLVGRLGVRRSVRFVESPATTVPATLGWMYPMVLFPVGWVTATPMRDVEAIVLHELAHIANRDFLNSIVRECIVAVYYFNLPLRSVVRSLAADSELAADALAGEVFGDYSEYGKALLALERSRSEVALSLGATGGSLSGRIHHLVQLRSGFQKRAVRVAAMSFSCLCSLTAVGYAAAAATADREDLFWAQSRPLTQGVFEVVAYDRPNPTASILLRAALSEALHESKDLAALADSLTSGFDSGSFVAESEQAVWKPNYAALPLPTFGTAAARDKLATDLGDASRAAPVTQVQRLARASVMIAALDPTDLGPRPLSWWVRQPAVRDSMALRPAEMRRLDLLIAIQNRRMSSIMRTLIAANGRSLTDQELQQLIRTMDDVPGAWRFVAKISKPQIRKQIAAAIGRGDLN